MKSNLRVLDQVEIAKPCPANWDEMKGDDRVRRCSLCRLNVYNVEKMSREEAERLIRDAEGSVCLRLYRREDGTVITRDCPKGLAAFRQRVAKRLVLAASMVLASVGCGQVGDRLKEDFGIQRPAPTPPPTMSYVVGSVATVTPSKSTPPSKSTVHVKAKKS